MAQQKEMEVRGRTVTDYANIESHIATLQAEAEHIGTLQVEAERIGLEMIRIGGILCDSPSRAQIEPQFVQDIAGLSRLVEDIRTSLKRRDELRTDLAELGRLNEVHD